MESHAAGRSGMEHTPVDIDGIRIAHPYIEKTRRSIEYIVVNGPDAGRDYHLGDAAGAECAVAQTVYTVGEHNLLEFPQIAESIAGHCIGGV